MKAMILAAGRGERMRPLTDDRPKPLLKVNGKALIEWHIEALKDAGVKDILINTCWLGDMIPEYLGDGSYWGVNLTFSPEAKALETAGGIRHALDFFEGQPFVVVNGDVWSDIDFEPMVNKAEELMQKAQAHLVLVPNPAHHPRGDFVLEKNLVKEKGEIRWTFSGIGLYQPKLFESLPQNQPYPLGPLLRQVMDYEQVTGEVFEGKWHDIGTPQRLQQLNDSFSKSHKVIEFK
ncbi:MAG: nucleotidyltransferase family protein [Kangiellaceae bacterium]|nr:nucleotidyltransferase family protein [Kangiellaceae bacterium]